ncbi:AraC family transcriptional regulator [uncultured Pseudoteredinibacter sp.]|uniref:helix-turn-helix transcriptional regulator n=1 Tax=uncultured Pseudoteredinibacter sp. TaxID=1641701 RepID=UPI0026073EDF|nr:AraC family transcriptional regulator [uncultured Pseudoteredinibacter sp.]
MPVCEPSLSGYLKQSESSWMQALPGQDSECGSNGEVNLKLRDFQQRSGASITVEDSNIGPDDTLIRGKFYNSDLRQGLNLRCSNTKEEHAFCSDSSHAPGLSCIFFLRGAVDVEIGNCHFDLKPKAELGGISATAVLKRESESFKRITKQAQYVRHLVVTASPEWLSSSGFEQRLGPKLQQVLKQQNMASRQWHPSQRLNHLIKDIFSPSLILPELIDLHLEARTIDIVSETLTALILASGESSQESALGRHDNIRLQRAREFILADPSHNLSVELIAKEAGISASGLQRLFQRVENCSVFDYVRKIRLEVAHDKLGRGHCSVQEASMLAGYKSAANFATAFKRYYGKTPRQVLMGTL